MSGAPCPFCSSSGREVVHGPGFGAGWSAELVRHNAAVARASGRRSHPEWERRLEAWDRAQRGGS